MSLAQTLPCRPVTVTAPEWLAIHALALWPHAAWAARRVADGSDDPLGIAALAVLLLWLWRAGESLRATPRQAWLGAAGALTVAATAALFIAPPLAAALLAALAISAHVFAWLPDRSPRVALAGLALLALPLIASLQFYAGYPLRVFTAQFSSWLLQAIGVAAERSGTAMTVNHQLVIVDAPCSGVQMAWLAYFAASSVALLTQCRDASFVRRLPLVGLAVLTGNVLRNTTLVALEAQQRLAPWAHEAIGLVFLVIVIGLAVRLMAPRPSAVGA
jgi:exosortase/archaeosortase family protein